MLTAILAITPLCIIGVILTAESWWEGLIIVVGLVLTFSVLQSWSLDGYPPRAFFAFAFTGATWILCAVLASGPLSFVPFALLGALLLARLPARRLLLTVVFALAVAVLGAAVFFTHPVSFSLIDGYIVLPIAGTLFIAGVVLVSEQSWLLVRRLDRAKEAEAELAVANERMRFAGDLHDIQGHTLHVIKLKSALAQRLLSDDPGRARSELDEIRVLVDESIKRTRDLAYAQHEIEFVAELENARRVCEAAGIDVDLRFDGGASTTANPLLAHVLREATTNLLRHADPSHVSIAVSTTASRWRVDVANDGVPDDGGRPLRGLARLRDRIELAGGSLSVERVEDRFVVAAVLDSRSGGGGSDREPPRAAASGEAS